MHTIMMMKTGGKSVVGVTCRSKLSRRVEDIAEVVKGFLHAELFDQPICFSRAINDHNNVWP